MRHCVKSQKQLENLKEASMIGRLLRPSGTARPMSSPTRGPNTRTRQFKTTPYGANLVSGGADALHVGWLAGGDQKAQHPETLIIEKASWMGISRMPLLSSSYCQDKDGQKERTIVCRDRLVSVGMNRGLVRQSGPT